MTTRQRKATRSAPPSAASFPIVGIGASAGGLAAIEEFLAALPAGRDLGAAFVLAQHLDPDHKSLLPDLVKRYTSMEVTWAEDGMEVLPGCAYVLPPNKDMTLVGGKLRLARPEAPRGQRLPIDRFFRSLAADQHERAVCIVLSGTGSDGTLGLRAIKGEGGMAIVQSIESAGFGGMPRTAIDTGLADYVLSPAEMPEPLLRYVDRAFARVPQAAGAEAPDGADLLQPILQVLRGRSGHDFTHYKATMLRRRVERRMAMSTSESMEDYLALLKGDTLEVETLFRELLIGVTDFFRDPAAFEALATKALRGLIAAHDAGEAVRIWVPGCSTGEEAYSIAMLVQEEAAAGSRRNVPVRVFATDLDAEAVERARAGVYPDSIQADVSPERLERFFVQDGGYYRVSKAVRDCVIFAKQDVTKDPPFSKVDVISCRNLLIYMDSDLQQRLMPLFHYAIKPGGYLFLGSSEAVGDAAELFAAVDKKWRLFKRRPMLTPRQELRTAAMSPTGAVGSLSPAPREAPLRVRVRDMAERTLLEQLTPASVVVNAEGEVLYVHGRTGRYLELPAGEPSGSLLKMARKGLQFELASGTRRALMQNETVRYERLRVRSEDGSHLVNLTIQPMSGPEAVKGLLMVAFEDVPEEGVVNVGILEPFSRREQELADLDRELAAKEEVLRAAVEQMETSNEQLLSTSEDMQSSNEELQSTNEELETSREELQSVNEELISVNSELQQRVQDLGRANSDMSNMFAGTGIGTLFVDEELCIQRFTPAVTTIMNLIPGDVGRPLGDITQRLRGDADLVSVVTSVLATLATVETQVEDDAGSVYQMRVQPYRTLEGVIDGAVLTFVDVTEQRRLQATLDKWAKAAAEAGEFAQSVLDTVREPQLVLDGELTVVTANKAFLATFEEAPDAVLGHPLGEIYGGAWLKPELLELLLEVLPEKKRLEDYGVTLTEGTLGPCTVTLNALELLQTSEKRRLILLTVTNVARDA